jgi:hypothetical protein
MHVSVGQSKHLPPDLLFDIEHYKGTRSCDSSLSSTPDGLSTPPQTKTSRLRTPDDGLKTPTPSKVTELNCNSDNHKDGSETNVAISQDTVDSSCSTPHIPPQSDLKSSCNENSSNYFLINPKNIPRSPHLSKDFSPTGERIRSSIRARRQQRMLQNREKQRNSSELEKDSDLSASEPTSLVLVETKKCNDDITESVLESVKATLEKEKEKAGSDQLAKRVWGAACLKEDRPRPYGEKGYLINLNGSFSINNVKDLDNCSDFDSSCDTSLNYHDVNPPPPSQPCDTAQEDSASPQISSHVKNLQNKFDEKLVMTFGQMESPKPKRKMVSQLKKTFSNEVPGDQRPPPVRNWKIDNMAAKVDNPITKEIEKVESKPPAPSAGQKSYKSALEDIKLKLNLSKVPVEETSKIPVVETKTTHRMFSRINPLASPIFDKRSSSSSSRFRSSSPSPVDSNKSKPNRLFRIGDTPIFERRNVKSLLPTLFKRSDSDENLPASLAAGSYNKRSSQCLSPKQLQPVQSPSSQSQEKIFTFKPRISPTTDLRPNYSFHTSETRAITPPSSKPESKFYNLTSTKNMPKINSNYDSLAITSNNINSNRTNKFVCKNNKPLLPKKLATPTSPPAVSSTSKIAEKYISTATNHAKTDGGITDSQQYSKISKSSQPLRKSQPPPLADAGNRFKTSNSIGLMSPESIHKLSAKMTEAKNNNNNYGTQSAHTTNSSHNNSGNPRNSITRTTTTMSNNVFAQKLPTDAQVKRNCNKYDNKTNKSTKSFVLESTAL